MRRSTSSLVCLKNMDLPNRKVAVVTGGSGGIGHATAELFAARDLRVFELSRSGKSGACVMHIDCDVSDEQSVERAIALVIEAAGRIDILVNNAGMGISGAVEQTEAVDAARIFQVNFFGSFYMVKHAMPYLRESRGSVVFVSSVAAVVAIPFQAFYSASKAAINLLGMGLRQEVAPYGVRVCAVMPGDVKTGFTAARDKNEQGDTVYGTRIHKAVASMEKDEQSGMPPSKVADCIVKVALKKSPRPLYVVGEKYRLFTMVAKFLPQRLVSFIVGKMYG